MQCGEFDSCLRFVEKVIEENGHIDVLVNNAGITRDGLLMRMSEEDFDRVIDTNLKGTFHMIRFCIPLHVKAEKGTYHQYGICGRRGRKCGTGELCGI